MNVEKLRYLAAIGQAIELSKRTEADPSGVIDKFERALSLNRTDARGLTAYSDYLRATGHTEAAYNLLVPHLATNQGFDLAFSLGHCASSLKRWDVAEQAYRQAASYKPEHAMAHSNLGYCLYEQGRFEQAYEQYTEALILEPSLRIALANLMMLLVKMERWSEFIPFCIEYLQTEPSDQYEFLLGRAYEQTQALTQAKQCWMRVLERTPHHEGALTFLGGMFYRSGEMEQARQLFGQALALNPDNPTYVSNYLLSLNYTHADPLFVLAEHRRCTQGWGKPSVARLQLQAGVRSQHRALKVGFVSTDLFEHPVGQLLIPTLEALQSMGVRCFAYLVGGKKDQLTDRLMAALPDACRDLRPLGMEQMHEAICNDELDIAIDLNGHTGDSKLKLFAKPMAAVQMTYLGYPNTTGLATIDYRITDDIADPVGMTEAFHSEQLLRLPAPFLCLQQPGVLPPVNELPLNKTGSITFGCFNNLAKLSEDTLRAWSRIMKGLPGCRLILKAAPLADEGFKSEYKQHLAQFGLDLERVTLHGRMSFEKHLLLYHQIDVALDPFPYNGTATSIESLWMGVPVLTVTGNNHVSRVGTSLMHSLNLDNFVCDSVQAYIDRAIDLPNDAQALSQVREQLRGHLKAHPASSPAELARKLKAAFEQVI